MCAAGISIPHSQRRQDLTNVLLTFALNFQHQSDMVAPWTIYAKRLFPLGYGYPLWCPGPSLEFGEIQIGDVGYLAFGHFHFLFNCFHPAGHPRNIRGVPDGFETLEMPSGSIQEFPNELSPTLLKSEGIQSVVTDGQGGFR